MIAGMPALDGKFRRTLFLACLAAIGLAFSASRGIAQGNGLVQVAPHDGYWAGFPPFVDGDFQEALRTFRNAGQGAVSFGGTPWIDSICYHTMIGECHYQMGSLGEALEQYSAALKIYVANSNWMLRIDFSPEIMPEQSVKTTITWGPSSRKALIGRFPPTFQNLQGRLDNSNVLRTGGVIAAPQIHPVYVAEIIRCTSVALARRRELLGPVCPYDPLTAQLVDALARRPGPPNHWSQSWVELQLGLAYASANMIPQAVNELQKSLLVAGQYDHPLTSLALLELGRLAAEQEKFDVAVNYFHEASLSAAVYDRTLTLEEAFRRGAEAHLLSGKKNVYPPLNAALASQFSKDARIVSVTLLTALAEQLCSQGSLPEAAAAIGQARTEVARRSMAQGAMGGRLNYQTARIALHAGDAKAAVAPLAAAMTFQKNSSPKLFQIGIADGLFRSGSVTERIAELLFSEVLREPTRTDWTVDPAGTLATLSAPHALPYEHWLELALARKEHDKALEIAERIKRHRFFVSQQLGGRLVALRWILAGPEQSLSQEAILSRQELLTKFPKFGESLRRSQELRDQLQALPLLPTAEAEVKRQGDLFAELAKASQALEGMLAAMALDRVASEMVFPPLRSAKEIRKELPDGTLVLNYLVTSRNIHVFAISNARYSNFAVAQSGKLKNDIIELLRQLGLHDRNQPVAIDELKPNAWQLPARRLFTQLSSGIPAADWASHTEIVIIPDGPLWYLPFEALMLPAEQGGIPLLMQAALRYAPTLGLAIPDGRGMRPVARTAIVPGKLNAREDDAFTAAAAESIASALPAAAILRAEPRISSGVFCAALDRLVVLKDHDDADKLPFNWSPLRLDAGKPGSTLADWGQLPFAGADQVILPAFHTPAEYSLKRGGQGDELFLAACGLMASGCRTVLLSRWRVGGQNTVDLMREFVQELPHQRASAAWRRSVQLSGSRQLDPALEPRIKASSASRSIAADHPFLWSGYMLLDTGVVPKQ